MLSGLVLSRHSFVATAATAACVALVAVGSGGVRAEDIDLFAGAGAGAGGNPTLLLVVDNSASGNEPLAGASKLEVMRRSIATAVATLTDVTGQINVGIIAFDTSGSDATQPARPYVRYAARPMSDAANRANLVAALQGIDAPAGATERAPFALGLEQARRYLGGLGPVGPAPAPGLADDGAALTASGAAFVSPLGPDGCDKILLLMLGAGPPSNSDAAISAPYIAALNGGTLPAVLRLPAPYPAPALPATQLAAGDWADELAGLLRRTPYADAASAASGTVYPETLLTYAVAVHDPGSSTDNAALAASGRALLRSAASQGGAQYFDATDETSIALALEAIFAEALSIHAVFSAPALPASTNPAGTFADQLYMGMFRVDGLGRPRWTGNLRQFRLAVDSSSGTIDLLDARGQPALDPLSGFVAPTATSYWTTARTTGPVLPSGSTTVDFFMNAPAGTGLSTVQQARDLPDGNVIEKGGAAQRLRAARLGDQTGRKLYTCPLAGCSAGAALATDPAYRFDTTAIRCATHLFAFGANPATCTDELPALVEWIRGADNTTPGNEVMPGPGGLGPAPVRASIHGDVIHSKPLLVDYGASGVVAFYGGNDGVLRALRAGRGAGAGDELWGFVAPEHFGKFKRLRDNAPVLEWPSRSSGLASPLPIRAGAAPKDWLQDGTLTSFQAWSAAGAVTAAYLFATARRGGTFVYAFDVTDPAAPRFLWRHAAHDGSDAAFDDLALTFSAARPAMVAGYAGPVVVFGGGYAGGYDAAGDPIAEDASPRRACSATVALGCGNRIFVVDAVSGALVRSFQANANGGGDLTHGVAGDVTLVDTQSSGTVDRAYAADVGGSLWRIDFDARGPAEWRLYKLARTADAAQPRKFLQAPDVVVTRQYVGVLAGSGDREKPLQAGGRDRFYLVKDRIVATTVAAAPAASAAWPIDLDATASDAMIDVTLLGAEDARSRLAADSNNGWFRALGDAEKVVNPALTAGGIVYFGTHQPEAATGGRCLARLGTARGYAVAFSTGTPVRDNDDNGTIDARDASVPLTGGGMPPPTIGGLATVRDDAAQQDVLVPFVIGTGGSGGGGAAQRSPISPARIEQKLSRSVRKTYWYQRPLP